MIHVPEIVMEESDEVNDAMDDPAEGETSYNYGPSVFVGKRGPLKKSPIWDYFTAKLCETTEVSACNYCNYTSKGRNTTTLRVHLKKHQEQFKEFEVKEAARPPGRRSFFPPLTQQQQQSTREGKVLRKKNQLNRASPEYYMLKANLTRLAACTPFPLQTVESREFQLFVRGFDPRAADSLPCRNTLKNWVTQYTSTFHNSILDSLAKPEERQEDGEFSGEFPREDTVVPNYQQEFPKHLACVLHTLTHLCSAILDKKESPIYKLKKEVLGLIKKFSATESASEVMKKLFGQAKLGKISKIRWNAFYFVLKSMEDNQELVVQLCHACDWPITFNWSHVTLCHELLKPMVLAINYLEADRYPTVSSVIPALLSLQDHLTDEEGIFLVFGNTTQQLLFELNRRFESILDFNCQSFDASFLICTMLNPERSTSLTPELFEEGKRQLLVFFPSDDAAIGSSLPTGDHESIQHGGDNNTGNQHTIPHFVPKHEDNSHQTSVGHHGVGVGHHHGGGGHHHGGGGGGGGNMGHHGVGVGHHHHHHPHPHHGGGVGVGVGHQGHHQQAGGVGHQSHHQQTGGGVGGVGATTDYGAAVAVSNLKQRRVDFFKRRRHVQGRNAEPPRPLQVELKDYIRVIENGEFDDGIESRDFWMNNTWRFPKLAPLALVYQSIPVFSTSAE